jgi:glycosyltransferase involved in cell wall biosynthesis
MLGNLRQTKGTLVAIEAILDAAKSMDRPPIFDVFGAPLYQTETFIRELARLERAGKGVIHLHGRYHHEEVPKLINDSAWVVVPSLWWENAPLVINEAFSQGRPVLCSNIGGMAESVRNGIDGVHVPAGDRNAWSDAFQRLGGNDKLWQQLSNGIVAPGTSKQAAAEFLGMFDLFKAA